MRNQALSVWSLEQEQSYRAVLLDKAVKAAKQPLQATWIIAPHALLEWYKEEATNLTPIAPIACLTWEQACDTLEELLLLPSWQRPNQLELQVALAGALGEMTTKRELPAEILKAFNSDPLGVSGSLISALRYWQSWGQSGPISARDAITRRHLELLQSLTSETERILNTKGLASASARWKHVTEAIAQQELTGLPSRILIDGFDRLDASHRQTLDALKARGIEITLAPWLAETGEELPASVPMVSHTCAYSLRDPQAEVQFALNWLYDRHQEGLSLRDIAIMVPPEAGYEPRLHHALASKDIPHRIRWETPLANAPQLQGLSAYLRLTKENVDAVELVTLLQATGHLEGEQGIKRISELYSHLPQTWQEVRTLLPECPIEKIEKETQLTLSGKLEHYWNDWVDAPELQAKCQSILEACQSVLGDEALSTTGFLKALWALGEPLEQKFSAETEALSIWSSGPYAPSRPKALLVLGFNEGAFPRQIAMPPLLGPLELEALETQGIQAASPSDLAEHEARNVWRILSLAQEVTLSIPERDHQGHPLRPSPFAENIPTCAIASSQSTPVLEAVKRREYSADSRHLHKLLRTLSPSAGDLLLECPLAFFAQSLLRLEEQPPARCQGLDVALAGTISHRVMEVLLAETPDTALSVQSIEPTLFRVLDEDFPAFDQGAYRVEIEEIRRRLEAFIPRYTQLTKALGVTHGASEWKFGYEKKVELQLEEHQSPYLGSNLPIGGYIDRVLFRKGRPIAIDFKSGNVAKYRKQRGVGLGSQVAFYSWAIADQWEAPEAFIYCSFRDGKIDAVVSKTADQELIDLLDAAPGTETLEDIQQMIREDCTESLEKLLTGDISPVEEERRQELESVLANPCTFCTNSLLCGRSEA